MEYGLIGEKLKHSFSLEVHNLIGKYDYSLKEIPKSDLKDFILKKDYKGLNVTIPYKMDVIPFLDEVSESALKIGAVNTIVNKKGKLYGYNTDFLGARDLILYNGIEIKDKKVLILGSGGTSLTLKSVVSFLGAKDIIILSRNPKNDQVSYEDAIKYHNDAQIVINTTPVGTYPNVMESPIDLEPFKNLNAVIDVVYNPLRTKLLEQAKALKVKGVSGLYMLVSQAVHASSLFLGEEIDDKIVEKIYKKIYFDKVNIVLSGMPTCGKTSVGKAIALKTCKEFIDVDKLIEEKFNMKIVDIFSKFNEEYFRNLETQTIKELTFLNGKIISLGGGAILSSENQDYLLKNGSIVFIDRSLENLIVSSDRPLTSDKEKLTKKYNERLPIYKSTCDYIVDGNKSIDEVANNVLKEFI